MSAHKKPLKLYILRCRDNSLYTGITTDIDERLRAHNAGNAAKYTRARLPVNVVYTEQCSSRSLALKREWQIKGWTKRKKEAFVKESAQPFIKAGQPH
ncbi:MAG: GIY-YIG nuclease family protein [candidate division Zixibacteria bacterium]|nr:GIY-YIG nuclease family protein [candidate division Zixibacteria bacterium]